MKNFFVRIALASSVLGSAWLTSQLAHKAVLDYSYTYSQASSIEFGRWQTITWVLIGLGSILAVWATLALVKIEVEEVPEPKAHKFDLETLDGQREFLENLFDPEVDKEIKRYTRYAKKHKL
jgi:hypothetical protein